MKILFIVTQSELGGAQRWVFDTATGLKNKHRIIVAAGDGGPLLEKLRRENIPVHRLKHLTRNINPFSDLLGTLEIYYLIKKERPDIIQLCSAKAGFLGSIAGKLANTPKIIYRIGGWSFNDPRPRWINLIFIWLEKLTAPLKDKIIVNSQHDFDQALKLQIYPKEKLVLIYNGIRLKESVTETAQAWTRYFRIGAIANDYPTKGLKYLLEAGKKLENQLEIIIVGSGSKIGPKENPWQYFADIGGIDIFVIPSVKEGLPYVLLEAMAAGLPIVATTVGGIPEIIKDGENGLLVPPKNPEKLAAAIKKLIEDGAFRKKLGASAREDIKKFSLEKMAAEFENLLLQL